MVIRGTFLLDQFVAQHRTCRSSLAAWRNEVEEARWQGAEDLRMSRLVAAHDPAANSVLFTVAEDMCLVMTKVSFHKGLLLVERAWCPAAARKAA